MNTLSKINKNGINSNDAKQPSPVEPVQQQMQMQHQMQLQMPQESGQQKRKLPEVPRLVPRKKCPTEADYVRMRYHDTEVDQGYESQGPEDLLMCMWM